MWHDATCTMRVFQKYHVCYSYLCSGRCRSRASRAWLWQAGRGDTASFGRDGMPKGPAFRGQMHQHLWDSNEWHVKVPGLVVLTCLNNIFVYIFVICVCLLYYIWVSGNGVKWSCLEILGFFTMSNKNRTSKHVCFWERAWHHFQVSWQYHKLCCAKETKITRHGNMLVGGTLGGKSVCWKTLAKAKCILKSMGQEGALPIWESYKKGSLEVDGSWRKIHASSTWKFNPQFWLWTLKLSMWYSLQLV